MSYKNWKHILECVFSFHNSIFNGISIIKTIYGSHGQNQLQLLTLFFFPLLGSVSLVSSSFFFFFFLSHSSSFTRLGFLEFFLFFLFLFFFFTGFGFLVFFFFTGFELLAGSYSSITDDVTPTNASCTESSCISDDIAEAAKDITLLGCATSAGWGFWPWFEIWEWSAAERRPKRTCGESAEPSWRCWTRQWCCWACLLRPKSVEGGLHTTQCRNDQKERDERERELLGAVSESGIGPTK